ncbi:MAG TPA: phage terminase large subunit [Solirubrobacteraceae bacterium]
MQPPTKTEIKAELARRSLYEFLTLMWPVFEPGSPFVDGLHIRLVCELLEAVTRGGLTRLIINIPPRHGKSNVVSIIWPAWVWASHPERRWLFASFAQSLSERHSTSCRRLIESPEYQRMFGNAFALASDANQKFRFENNRGGARLASSIGGAATGEGGDIIVIDDPHKIEDAGSDTARETVLDCFDQTLSTRLNDPRTGAIVIVCQRLHERDLVGHLLDRGGWEHLCLPAEHDSRHPYLSPHDPRTTDGELLWPERYGAAEIANLKRQLGSYGAAAQLQQLPAPAGGGIFPRNQWRWYSPDRPPRNLERIIISVDLAFGGSTRSDYTVGQVWGAVGTDKYLLHQLRDQLAFGAQLQMIRDLVKWVAISYPRLDAPGIYVEHAANADALMDTLRHQLAGLILRRPEGDKQTRALAIVPQIEAGNVHLPGAADAQEESYDRSLTPESVQRLVDETAAFPNAAYDDQVDALTQAISELSRPTFRIRSLSG